MRTQIRVADVFYWFACVAAAAFFASAAVVIAVHHGEWRVVVLAGVFSALIWATGGAVRYLLSPTMPAHDRRHPRDRHAGKDPADPDVAGP
jgi:hypothetical protein